MSLLEERILRIIELREKGLEDKAIANELGLEEKTIKLYEDSTKKAINDLVFAGYKQEKIAKNVGLSLTAFNLFTTYYNIKTTIPSKKRYKPKTQSIAEIKQAIAEGADSVEELIEKLIERTGLEIKTILDYAYKPKIKLPFSQKDIWKYYKPIPRDEKCDKLIKEGLSLGKIAKDPEILKLEEVVRQYILKTGQHEEWKEKRKYFKNKKREEKLRQKTLSGIVSVIYLIAAKKLKEELREDEKWAYDKSMEYLNLTRHHRRISHSSLFTLFKKYSDMKREGKKLSLEELGKDQNMWPAMVGRILKKVEEEPLFGARERKVITKEKKEALNRINKIKMNCTDIIYFLGLNQWNVYAYFNKHPKKKSRTRINKCIVDFGKGKKLTYRLASKIYEAQDLEFSKKDIIYLLDIPEKIVDYAQEHRKTIAYEIIDALKVLYPKKIMTKPYVNFK